MRKLILMMQVSFDGYFESPDRDMSWMAIDDDDGWKDVLKTLQSVDLFLLGRVMYPEYRDHWKNALTDPKASANEVAYARLAEKTKHIVFSHTMTNPDWHNTEIINGNVVDEILRLKNLPGQSIYVVGGGKLAATVIEAGLVDDYSLTINPTILGSGKSFFHDQHTKHALELNEVKPLKSGAVVMKYRAKKQ